VHRERVEVVACEGAMHGVAVVEALLTVVRSEEGDVNLVCCGWRCVAGVETRRRIKGGLQRKMITFDTFFEIREDSGRHAWRYAWNVVARACFGTMMSFDVLDGFWI
jgi:hypothetical protein